MAKKRPLGGATPDASGGTNQGAESTSPERERRAMIVRGDNPPAETEPRGALDVVLHKPTPENADAAFLTETLRRIYKREYFSDTPPYFAWPRLEGKDYTEAEQGMLAAYDQGGARTAFMAAKAGFQSNWREGQEGHDMQVPPIDMGPSGAAEYEEEKRREREEYECQLAQLHAAMAQAWRSAMGQHRPLWAQGARKGMLGWWADGQAEEVKDGTAEGWGRGEGEEGRQAPQEGGGEGGAVPVPAPIPHAPQAMASDGRAARGYVNDAYILPPHAPTWGPTGPPPSYLSPSRSHAPPPPPSTAPPVRGPTGAHTRRPSSTQRETAAPPTGPSPRAIRSPTRRPQPPARLSSSSDNDQDQDLQRPTTDDGPLRVPLPQSRRPSTDPHTAHLPPTTTRPSLVPSPHPRSQSLSTLPSPGPFPHPPHRRTHSHAGLSSSTPLPPHTQQTPRPPHPLPQGTDLLPPAPPPSASPPRGLSTHRRSLSSDPSPTISTAPPPRLNPSPPGATRHHPSPSGGLAMPHHPGPSGVAMAHQGSPSLMHHERATHHHPSPSGGVAMPHERDMPHERTESLIAYADDVYPSPLPHRPPHPPALHTTTTATSPLRPGASSPPAARSTRGAGTASGPPMHPHSATSRSPPLQGTVAMVMGHEGGGLEQDPHQNQHQHQQHQQPHHPPPPQQHQQRQQGGATPPGLRVTSRAGATGVSPPVVTTGAPRPVSNNNVTSPPRALSTPASPTSVSGPATTRPLSPPLSPPTGVSGQPDMGRTGVSGQPDMGRTGVSGQPDTGRSSQSIQSDYARILRASARAQASSPSPPTARLTAREGGGGPSSPRTLSGTAGGGMVGRSTERAQQQQQEAAGVEYEDEAAGGAEAFTGSDNVLLDTSTGLDSLDAMSYDDAFVHYQASSHYPEVRGGERPRWPTTIPEEDEANATAEHSFRHTDNMQASGYATGRASEHGQVVEEANMRDTSSRRAHQTGGGRAHSLATTHGATQRAGATGRGGGSGPPSPTNSAAHATLRGTARSPAQAAGMAQTFATADGAMRGTRSVASGYAGTSSTSRTSGHATTLRAPSQTVGIASATQASGYATSRGVGIGSGATSPVGPTSSTLRGTARSPPHPHQSAGMGQTTSSVYADATATMRGTQRSVASGYHAGAGGATGRVVGGSGPPSPSSFAYQGSAPSPTSSPTSATLRGTARSLAPHAPPADATMRGTQRSTPPGYATARVGPPDSGPPSDSPHTAESEAPLLRGTARSPAPPPSLAQTSNSVYVDATLRGTQRSLASGPAVSVSPQNTQARYAAALRASARMGSTSPAFSPSPISPRSTSPTPSFGRHTTTSPARQAQGWDDTLRSTSRGAVSDPRPAFSTARTLQPQPGAARGAGGSGSAFASQTTTPLRQPGSGGTRRGGDEGPTGPTHMASPGRTDDVHASPNDDGARWAVKVRGPRDVEASRERWVVRVKDGHVHAQERGTSVHHHNRMEQEAEEEKGSTILLGHAGSGEEEAVKVELMMIEAMIRFVADGIKVNGSGLGGREQGSFASTATTRADEQSQVLQQDMSALEDVVYGVLDFANQIASPAAGEE